jgi:hypothetical protein
MSATNDRALTGSAKSAAPFGAVALIAGVVALGAIGVALGQGIKSTPAAGTVPADVQAALIAQRMGEKAPLFAMNEGKLQTRSDETAAAAASTNGRIIQHQGELSDRFGTRDHFSFTAPTPFVPAIPDRWSGLSTNTYAQGLLSHNVPAKQPVREYRGRGLNHNR